MRKYSPEEWLAAFLSKLEANGVLSCWNWTGAKTKDGYGTVVFRGKVMHAHRAFFLHMYGPLSPTVGVLHSCDNRKCCNPFHWFTGNQRRNIQDCVSKGRHRGAPGESNAAHLLTAEKVLQMRRIRAITGVPYCDIAKQFGVSEPCASQAVRGYTWSHLTDNVR